MLNVSLDVQGVTEMLTEAERSVIPKATARTLNRTATQVQRRALKLIAKDLGLKQKDVRKYFKIYRASWSNLSANIEAKSKRIPVHKLGARQTKKGVSYRSQGRRKTIPGAFIGRVRTNTPGAYKRAGKARLPVKFLRTVSVDRVMIKAAIDRAMWEVAQESWGKNFPHEVEFYLRRAGYIA